MARDAHNTFSAQSAEGANDTIQITLDKPAQDVFTSDEQQDLLAAQAKVRLKALCVAAYNKKGNTDDWPTTVQKTLSAKGFTVTIGEKVADTPEERVFRQLEKSGKHTPEQLAMARKALGLPAR